ncbi:MAG: hypothetical protein JWQ15_1115 [Marmoricola sp.]|nr:hypothetical protein [Marmoricola sp.]
MTTSNTTIPLTSRKPLRLRMVEHPGRQPLDGGWWPHSRDLTTELADLVDNFPADHGRIVRVGFSPPDWDDAPRRVPTARGYVKVGFDPQDDTHVVVLTTSDRKDLCVLVVPPDLSRAKGDKALLAAVTPRYASSPAALLMAVRESPDVDDGERGDDEGEAWWGSDTAPSYRNLT